MIVASKQYSPETRIITQLKKLQWVTRLLVNPKFYDTIDNSIFQNASKLDSTLSTICYFSLFLSQLILLKPKLVEMLPQWVSVKKGLTECEKTISEKLKMISSYLSDIRIFNRMWAAIPLMSWLLSVYHKILTTPSTKYSSYEKFIDFIQVTSCLFLQIFENIGFIGDHSFSTQSENTSLWFNIWCCKLWALYVVSDIIKILSSKGKLDKLALISNLANLPLTVHWSLPEGCLTPLQVGICGTFSSCLNTLNDWKEVLQEIRKIKN